LGTEAIIASSIKPQLIKALGRQIANSLLTQGTLAYVSTDGSEKERFEAFINSICSDERLISVWGEKIAAGQAEEWKALAGSLFNE